MSTRVSQVIGSTSSGPSGCSRVLLLADPHVGAEAIPSGPGPHLEALERMASPP